MNTHPYTVVIERDLDSGWLIGEVVELPGCHTQAPDMTTLEANIREAIEVYLEVVEDVEAESVFVGTMRLDIPA